MKKLLSIFILCSCFYVINSQVDKKESCHYCKPCKHHKKIQSDTEMTEALNQLYRRYPRKYSKLHTDSVGQDDFGYAPRSHTK